MLKVRGRMLAGSESGENVTVQGQTGCHEKGVECVRVLMLVEGGGCTGVMYYWWMRAECGGRLLLAERGRVRRRKGDGAELAGLL